MAIDTSAFQQYSYIKDNGLNKYLIEEYLLPGLAVQSRLGKASRGIPLPTTFGKPQEFIKLEDAATLVLSWLEDNNHLYAKDKGQLIKLMRKVSYEQFATIASEIYQDRVEDPNKLFTTARQQNLELYRAAQKKQTTAPRPKFDPGKAIDDYNQLYSQLLRATNLGTSPALFQKILPLGVPVGRSDLSKQVLAQIIIQNITELRGAAHAYVGDEEKAVQAVSRKLGAIIATSYPEQSAYLNLLGDKEISTNLNKFTENIERQLIQDGIKLEEIDDLKNRAIASTGDVVATEYEIYQQIQSVIPFTSDAEKKKFAKALIQTINSSSDRFLTSEEIIGLTATRLGIDGAQIQAIQNELEKSGLNYAIEYRQNELSVIVDTHRLTLGERKLLRRGINPFKTEKSEADLTIEKDKLLKEFEIDSGSKFTSIEEARQFEQSRDKPDINWTRRFREHEDQYGAYSFLDFDEKSIINRTRFGRWVENSRSRMYELQTKFFDKWVEFDENLPWNKGVRRIYEWYDKLAESTLIPGTKIPIFRIVPWIYERIDEWKKVTTLSAIAKTSTWKSPVGKFIHWNLNQYKLGDYTVNGAVYETFHTAWGSSTKWVLEKSVAWATKLGVGSAFKYATVSASRTATRLLLQVGGRGLARLGTKAIGALVAAGTAIGTVFSAALAVFMVFDLIKLGYNVVKNFLTNGEFRKTVIGWGAAIATFVGAINFGSIGIALGVMFAWTLQTLLFSLLFIGIMTASITLLYRGFGDTINLDSGLSQSIVSVVCNAVGDKNAPPAAATQPKTSDSSSTNAAVAAGKCIYDFLEQFKINPLTAENAVGTAWNSFVAALGNAAASSIIQTSATGQGVFQCVGYIAGVGAMIGKPFNPTNACLYVNNPPSGFTWTTKPTVGCFFVIGSSTCSQCGMKNAPAGSCGHVGVVSAVNGAVVNALDANGGPIIWGAVRASAQFPVSSIAGYMCP